MDYTSQELYSRDKLSFFLSIAQMLTILAVLCNRISAVENVESSMTHPNYKEEFALRVMILFRTGAAS
jgi:hypothetical protein